jgi:mono/diheme cytochrome c family protein
MKAMGRTHDSSGLTALSALAALAALALAAASCGHKDPESTAPVAEPPAAPAKATLAVAQGDPERGHKLVAQFECSRCHEGTGTEAASFEKHCFHCHEKILTGEFQGPKSSMKRWRDLVDGLRDAPTLTATQKRLKRSWITGFLLNPYDLRPRLAATMPRLAITAEQARDIAAYLGAPDDPPDAAPPQGDAAHGRALIEAKGCPSCHAFTGVPKLAGAPLVRPNEKGVAPSVTLAPDLRTARDRLRPEALIGWIESPKAMKPDTAMPELPLTKEEGRGSRCSLAQ